MGKAQGSIEYLLVIAVVLIIVVLLSMFLFSLFSKSTTDALFESCRQAASTCGKNKALYGQSYDCFKMCTASCMDKDTGFDVMLGKKTDCIDAYDEKFDGSACGYCSAGLISNIVPKQ